MRIHSLQNLLSPLLRPVGFAYGKAMCLRSALYETEGRQYQTECPVVSVGNIAWGGTGKTPLVAYLLEKSKQKNIHSVVLTRGYKGKPPSCPFLVRPETDPKQSGDEPLLLAQKYPEAAVIVDPARSRAAAWAEKHLAPQLFILDDGMQHLAVKRDCDLVLLRPEDMFEDWGKIIPAGPWREGPEALKRASAFCMKIEPEKVTAIIPQIQLRLAALEKPFFSFTLAPAGLSHLQSPGTQPLPLARDLNGVPYTLVCGVGKPELVIATAEGFLGKAGQKLLFPDHHDFSGKDIEKIRAYAMPVVCTGKDAVKLAPLLEEFHDLPVWVIEIAPVFGPSLFTPLSFDAWFDAMLTKLLAHNTMPPLPE